MTGWFAFERRWCVELCHAIVPVGGDSPHTRPAAVSEACTHLLQAAPARFRAATRLAVWVVMWSPVLVEHRLRTLTALDPDRRDAVLEQTRGFRHPLVRDLVSVLQVVACICLVRVVDTPSAAAPGVRV